MRKRRSGWYEAEPADSEVVLRAPTQGSSPAHEFYNAEVRNDLHVYGVLVAPSGGELRYKDGYYGLYEPVSSRNLIAGFSDSVPSSRAFSFGVGGVTVGMDGEVAINAGNVNYPAFQTERSGGATKIGWFGVSPLVAKAGATSDLKDALVAYGLLTGGGATPLDLDSGALACGSLTIGGVTVVAHAAVSLDTAADGLLSLSTQQLGLDTQAANKVFAGPATGAAAAPTFRALVAADLPSIDHGGLGGLGDDDHSIYLLATGARTGASSQAQAFTNGMIGPAWKPAADSTTAIQIQNAAGTAVVNIDTTNKRMGIGTTAPGYGVHVADGTSSGARFEKISSSIGYFDFYNDGSGHLAAENTYYGVLTISGALFLYRDTAAGTTRFSIDSGGDTWWESEGAGLPYGSCWGNEINWVQTNAAQNTWYAISDADMTDGQLNLVTHDGSGKLTVTKAGRYLVNWSVTAEVSASNKHIQVGIGVTPSGGALTAQNDGLAHFEVSGANAELTLASTAILDLAASSAVECIIRTTDAGTPNLAVDHYNLTLVHVGGT